MFKGYVLAVHDAACGRSCHRRALPQIVFQKLLIRHGLQAEGLCLLQHAIAVAAAGNETVHDDPVAAVKLQRHGLSGGFGELRL